MPNLDSPLAVAAAISQSVFLLLGLAVLLRLGWRRRTAGPAAVRLPRWEILGFDFALATFLILVGGVGGQIAFMVAFAGKFDPDTELVWAGAAFQAGLAAGILLSRRHFRRRPPTLNSESAPRLRGMAIIRAGIGTFLAALPIVTLANLPWIEALERFGFDTTKQPLVDLFARTDSVALIASMIALATFSAPIVEETIFRGGLFRFLRLRTPRWVALAVPAMVFGSVHGSLVAFLPLAVLGLIFALAYERTGSIGVPMIAHGLFNLNTLWVLLSGAVPDVGS